MTTAIENRDSRAKRGKTGEPNGARLRRGVEVTLARVQSSGQQSASGSGLMRCLTAMALCVTVLTASEFASAQRVTPLGHAIVEYTSPDVKAVAAYEYSRRHHDGEWLLIELAIQATDRIAIERSQIYLLTSGERTVPLATQQEFRDDHQMLNQLLQNAKVWRRPLGPYFSVRPQATIQFFSYPGRIVHNSFVTNQDHTASGDLFFKAADSGWPAGNYRLVVNHEDARLELPIELD
jgi:hypothetical protein